MQFVDLMSERIEKLLQRACRLDTSDGISRRREELILRASEAGLQREYADQLYDVAEEEGVDPAAAFELVLCGVGVQELTEPVHDQWEETQVEAPPHWLVDAAPPPDEAARERRVRATFRRLRSIMERVPTASEALHEFVRDSDVGEVDY